MSDVPVFLKHLARYGEYPVPFVMLWIDGKPDFRAVDSERLIECGEKELCGICGRRLGEFSYFIGGDACKRSHIFLDPGMHRDCAEYSAKFCPFLNGERKRYSDRPVPSVKDLTIGHRPGFVPETSWILRSRTRSTVLLPESTGGVCFRAGLWLGAYAIPGSRQRREA